MQVGEVYVVKTPKRVTGFPHPGRRDCQYLDVGTRIQVDEYNTLDVPVTVLEGTFEGQQIEVPFACFCCASLELVE